MVRAVVEAVEASGGVLRKGAMRDARAFEGPRGAWGGDGGSWNFPSREPGPTPYRLGSLIGAGPDSSPESLRIVDRELGREVAGRSNTVTIGVDGVSERSSTCVGCPEVADATSPDDVDAPKPGTLVPERIWSSVLAANLIGGITGTVSSVLVGRESSLCSTSRSASRRARERGIGLGESIWDLSVSEGSLS